MATRQSTLSENAIKIKIGKCEIAKRKLKTMTQARMGSDAFWTKWKFCSKKVPVTSSATFFEDIFCDILAICCEAINKCKHEIVNLFRHKIVQFTQANEQTNTHTHRHTDKPAHMANYLSINVVRHEIKWSVIRHRFPSATVIKIINTQTS